MKSKNSQLLVYLKDYRYSNNCYYGFHQGRSTDDLLVYLTHRWAAAVLAFVGEGLTVDLDIAKVFDCVWNEALLVKTYIILAFREFMQVFPQDMLEDSSIRCYAHDKTVNTIPYRTVPYTPAV